MRFNTIPDHFRSTTPMTVSMGSLMARTYGLLAATLVVSTIASIYGMHALFAYEHPFVLMIGSFALLFAVQYTGSHRSPIAIPLVFLFAAGMGMMMGPAIAMYLRSPGGAEIVTEALGTTGAMFIGLSIYGATTKQNFGHLGGFLLTGLIVAILVSLLNLFVLHLPALQMAIAGVLVLVFSGLIILDTQRMVRGGIQEPVLLVVGLYLDIVNLFMALLQIFGGSRR